MKSEKLLRMKENTPPSDKNIPTSLKSQAFLLSLSTQVSLYQLLNYAIFLDPFDKVRALLSHLTLAIFFYTLPLILKNIRLALAPISTLFLIQCLCLGFKNENLPIIFSMGPHDPELFKHFFLKESWKYFIYFSSFCSISFFLAFHFSHYLKSLLIFKTALKVLVLVLILTDLLFPVPLLSTPQKNMNFFSYNILRISTLFNSKAERFQNEHSESSTNSLANIKLSNSLLIINIDGFSSGMLSVNLLEKLKGMIKKEELQSFSLLFSDQACPLCFSKYNCLLKRLFSQKINNYYISPTEISEENIISLKKKGFQNFVIPELSSEQISSNYAKIADTKSLLQVTLGLLNTIKKPAIVYTQILSFLPPNIVKGRPNTKLQAYLEFDSLIDKFLNSLNKYSDKIDIIIYSSKPNPIVTNYHPLYNDLGYVLIKSQTKLLPKVPNKSILSQKDFISLFLSLIKKQAFTKKDQSFDVLDNKGLKTIAIDEDGFHLCSIFGVYCQKINRVPKAPLF